MYFIVLAHWINLQLEDETHLVFVLECVVEVDEFWVVQLVHDVDLVLHRGLVQRVWAVDELRHEHAPRRLLNTPVNNAKSTTGNDDIIFSHILLYTG